MKAASEPTVPASRLAPSSVQRVIVPRHETLPPPPPGCRYVPVVLLGIVVADDHLRRRVDRWFHVPMIVLALLVLPLLLLDFLYIREGSEGGGATGGWMWALVIGGLTLIWIAFTVEFVVKIAIAESRWEYLRRNWIDMIIIVIPVLRPLRVAALARTTNAFRLRGVGFKLARYVFTLMIGMEATNRMMKRLGLRPRDDRKPPEQMTRHELMKEVARLRRLTDDWAQWHRAQHEYLASNGHGPLPGDHPSHEGGDESPVTSQSARPEPVTSDSCRTIASRSSASA